MSDEKNSTFELDEFNAFLKDLMDETDRAAVIIGAAKLDLLLYQLLQKYLLPNSTSDDEFLDSDRVLGTFSSRILASYRMGLLSAEFVWALHMIRKIRNAFAHELSSVSLNSGAQRDRITNLMQVMNRSTLFKRTLRDRISEGRPTPSTDFRAIAAAMYIRLEFACNNCDRLQMDHPYALLPPEPDDQVQQSSSGDDLRAAPEE